MLELHNPKNIKKKGNFLNRLIFDEIISTFLINSRIRKTIKKIKKVSKKFDDKEFNRIINKINFELTNDQSVALDEINKDLNQIKKCLDYCKET